MDIRIYYQKIRQIEAELPENPVVVSLETADGGKEGVRTEVSRAIAARLILERRARLAHEAEVRAFHEKQAEAKRIADEEATVRRVQVVLMPSGLTAAQPPKE